MKNVKNSIDRRNFLKVAGVAGLGSVIASKNVFADPNSMSESKTGEKAKYPQLPKRKLGRSDIEVPVISNGVMFNVVENPVILRANLRYGVTYWDTANGYAGGNSEIGVGQFFEKNPEVRKDIFLVTKASGARNAKHVEDKLQQSLRRMHTDYIDLYYGVHGCNDPKKQLTDSLAKWAEKAKKRKLIKYFGFSTHSNMAECLMAASKLPWIDAVMTSYNVSLMLKPEMKEAVHACNEAGVAVIAMKVIRGVQKTIPQAEEKVLTHFLDKGYTREQALIKIVLDDEKLTSACIRMENVSLLKTNVAAVVDKKTLTPEDLDALREYANATCSGYCAGCANICAGATPAMPYIAEVMRYLMYFKSYGDTDRARRLFAELPVAAKTMLTTADYSAAEARCPQRMPIAELMTEASQLLA